MNHWGPKLGGADSGREYLGESLRSKTGRPWVWEALGGLEESILMNHWGTKLGGMR